MLRLPLRPVLPDLVVLACKPGVFDSVLNSDSSLLKTGERDSLQQLLLALKRRLLRCLTLQQRVDLRNQLIQALQVKRLWLDVHLSFIARTNHYKS